MNKFEKYWEKAHREFWGGMTQSQAYCMKCIAKLAFKAGQRSVTRDAKAKEKRERIDFK